MAIAIKFLFLFLVFMFALFSVLLMSGINSKVDLKDRIMNVVNVVVCVAIMVALALIVLHI